jgi:hypothetical protein
LGWSKDHGPPSGGGDSPPFLMQQNKGELIMENNKKEARLVFNMGVGRALLKAGCTVIDVKPDRTNSDKTVLVFKNDEIFEREFSRINNEIAAAKVVQEAQ